MQGDALEEAERFPTPRLAARTEGRWRPGHTEPESARLKGALESEKLKAAPRSSGASQIESASKQTERQPAYLRRSRTFVLHVREQSTSSSSSSPVLRLPQHPSVFTQQPVIMAKSMRSKIKRKFRTELRKKIGVPHQAIQEAKIQDNLKRAIESQEGKSVLELKKLMGTVSAPVAAIDGGMEVDDEAAASGSLAKTEAEILNNEAELAAAAKEKKKLAKKLATKRRKKKFVHFHTLRKKGV